MAEGILAGMAKRRMAEIVHESDGLREVFVETERAGDGAGDLGDLHSVGQARAEVVIIGGGKDLRLVFEAAKSGGMDDAVAIALEATAVFVLGFRELAATRIAAHGGIRREDERFVLFDE